MPTETHAQVQSSTEANGPGDGERIGKNSPEAKSYLRQKAEQAKNLVKKLGARVSGRPQDAHQTLRTLAKGDYDERENSAGTTMERAADGSGDDSITAESRLKEQLQSPDLVGALEDTVQEPGVAQSGLSERIIPDDVTDQKPVQGESTLVSNYKAEVAAIHDNKPGRLSRMLPGGRARQAVYYTQLQQAKDRYKAEFDAGRTHDQTAEAVDPHRVVGVAKPSVENASSDRDGNSSPTQPLEASEPAVSQQSHDDERGLQAAGSSEFHVEVVSEGEMAQLKAQLKEVNGDPDKLSPDGQRKLLKFMRSQLRTQAGTISKAAIQKGTEALKQIDKDTVKELVTVLGVDPQSESGGKVFSLIDSATPEGIKGLWNEVTSVQGLKDMTVRYFNEYGISLNLKNLSKFAVSEVMRQFNGETDEQHGDKSAFRSKIMAMLAALGEALGTIALETVKAGLESAGDYGKK